MPSDARPAEAVDSGRAVNFNTGRPQKPKDTLAPQGEMDESGRRRSRRNSVEWDAESTLPAGDIHAAGTPGGGTSVGGLAGSNEGHGDPERSRTFKMQWEVVIPTLARHRPIRIGLRKVGRAPGGAVGGRPQN